MQKVLIIGSRGMLGQELVRVFRKDDDFEVVGWDKDEIDITKKEEVRKKLVALKPDIILNAAAYNAVDKCEESDEEFEKAKDLNGLAPGYIAEVSREIGAIFVHYSTDYVFGAEMPDIPEPEGCAGACSSCSLHEGFEPEIGFDENSKPAPVNKYGESKLMGEKEVQRKGEKYYIVRLSKLFGIPAQAEGAKKSFFDIMLEVGKAELSSGKVELSSDKKKKSVSVVDEETSSFTYAPDLAKKTKEIIEAKKEYGIYHIVNSDPCTWYEAVEELYAMTELKIKIEPVSGDEFPRPAQRPYFSVLLNKKLNPLRSYKEALYEYLKENKENK